MRSSREILRRADHSVLPEHRMFYLLTTPEPKGTPTRLIPPSLLAYIDPRAVSVRAYRHKHGLPDPLKPVGPTQRQTRAHGEGSRHISE